MCSKFRACENPPSTLVVHLGRSPSSTLATCSRNAQFSSLDLSFAPIWQPDGFPAHRAPRLPLGQQSPRGESERLSVSIAHL